MNKNQFYNQVNFYLASAATLLAFIAVILYAVNCPSEFNGNEPSSAVIGWDIVAIIFGAISVGGAVASMFFEKGIIAEVIKYTRLCLYVAFVALLVSFFYEILDEYSLLGTILYPIVSGTVGDPVEFSLSASYFTSLIFTLIACVLYIISALLKKSGSYKEEQLATTEGI